MKRKKWVLKKKHQTKRSAAQTPDLRFSTTTRHSLFSSLSSLALFIPILFVTKLRSFFFQVEEDFAEIDPQAIMPQGKRTRGVRVDYTSQEALEKAGLEANEDEESDDDVEMKD